jgi:uncharacterized protein (TIGR02145 family)
MGNDPSKPYSKTKVEKINKKLDNIILEQKIQKQEKEKKEREKKIKIKQKLKGEKIEPLAESFQHREEKVGENCGFEDEIYDGINYGRPFKIQNQTWLSYEFEVTPDMICPKVKCPVGWRIPTVSDYITLFTNISHKNEEIYEFLISDGFKMKKDKLYVTCTKMFKNCVVGNLDESWIFKCIGFKDLINQIRMDEYYNNQGKGLEDFIDDLQQKIEEQKINPSNDSEILSQDVNSKELVISDLMRKMDEELKLDKNSDNKEKQDKFLSLKNSTSNTLDLNNFKDYKNFDNNLLTSQIEPVNIPTPKNINKETELYDVYEINTFHHKPKLSCKLIANEVLGVDYISNTIGEKNCEMFFSIPKLCNIMTFEWDFGDSINTSEINQAILDEKNVNQNNLSEKKLSDLNSINQPDPHVKMKITKHIFTSIGEYKVKLNLTLFSNRNFILEKDIWIVEEIDYGPEDMIHNGINYGRPVKIGNQVWMMKDLKKYLDYKLDEISLIRGKGPGADGNNSYIDSISACPPGWRLPFKKDYENLLDYSGRTENQKLSFLFMKEGLNFKLNQHGDYDAICLDLIDEKESFMTFNDAQNKLQETNYPFDEKFINNIKSYNKSLHENLNTKEIYDRRAYCFSIHANKISFTTKPISLNHPLNYFSTRCIAAEKFDVDIGINHDREFYNVGEFIQFKIDYPNVLDFEWDFGDDPQNLEKKQRSKNPLHKYSVPGEYTIKVKMFLFGNRINKIEKKIKIIPDKNNLADKGISPSFTQFKDFNQIFVLPLGKKFKVKRNDKLHFTHQSVCICKSTKNSLLNSLNFLSQFKKDEENISIDSSIYVAFNDIKDLTMKVLHIKMKDILNQNFTSITTPVYKLQFAVPLDIIETKKGLVFLLKDLRDDNTLFIQCINPGTGEIIFNNCVMQNGAYPMRAEANQLIFIEADTEKPVFGMNAMHQPISGRLAYGDEKILVIFSYTNFFGYLSPDSERQDHLGETIITYSEDGKEVNLASNWSTSHSLTQRAIYDGRYFYTASLGDALPHNIKVVRVDPKIKCSEELLDSKECLENLNLNQKIDKNFFIDKFQSRGSLIARSSEYYVPNETNLQSGDKYFGENDKNLQDKKSDFELNSNYSSEINGNLKPDYPQIINLHSHSSSNPKIKNYPTTLPPSLSLNQKLKINMRHDFIYANIVQGEVPGDMRGRSSGRLADLIQLDKDTLVLVYSRIPCMDSGIINDDDEFAAIFFDSNLKVRNKIVFKKGENISCIKACKFAEDKLFIMYSHSRKMYKNKYLIDYCMVSEESLEEYDPVCSAFVINKKGELISKVCHSNLNLFNPSDDFESLEDGSIVWPFIDDENNLNLNFLFANQETYKTLTPKVTNEDKKLKRQNSNTLRKIKSENKSNSRKNSPVSHNEKIAEKLLEITSPEKKSIFVNMNQVNRRISSKKQIEKINNEKQISNTLKEIGVNKEDLHESIELFDESIVDDLDDQNDLLKKEKSKSKNKNDSVIKNSAYEQVNIQNNYKLGQELVYYGINPDDIKSEDQVYLQNMNRNLMIPQKSKAKENPYTM